MIALVQARIKAGQDYEVREHELFHFSVEDLRGISTKHKLFVFFHCRNAFQDCSGALIIVKEPPETVF